MSWCWSASRSRRSARYRPNRWPASRSWTPATTIPQRDGQIEELDTGAITSSGLLQRQLPDAQVVKVFNNIFFKHLASLARPHGAEDRSALPIAGDDAAAKAAVTAFLDSIGYDAVDTGLARRQLAPGARDPRLRHPLRPVLRRDRHPRRCREDPRRRGRRPPLAHRPGQPRVPKPHLPPLQHLLGGSGLRGRSSAAQGTGSTTEPGSSTVMVPMRPTGPKRPPAWHRPRAAVRPRRLAQFR